MPDPEDALRALADAAGGGDSEPQPETAPEPKPKKPSRPESPVAKEPPAPKKTQRPDAPVSKRPESPIARADDEAGKEDSVVDLAELSASQSADALAALSGTESAAYDPAEASEARSRRIPKPDVGMMQFRSAAVPVLCTVGLMMLALGVWGVLVKAGNTSMPMADKPDAGQYATIALIVGIPLALCLFAGAGFFLYQLGQDKKKLKAWEAEKKAARRG